MSSVCTNQTKRHIFWVHCNRCYEIFIKKERSFFLLACKHINCQPCLVEIEQDINGPGIYKCTVCRKVTRAVEINNSMPANLKDLFHPEPYLDGLNSFAIIMFQVEHRRRHFQNMDRQASRVKEIDKAAKKYKESAKNNLEKLYQANFLRKHAAKRLMSILLERRDRDSNSNSHNMRFSSFPKSSSLPSLKSGSRNGQNGITSFSQLSPKNPFYL